MFHTMANVWQMILNKYFPGVLIPGGWANSSVRLSVLMFCQTGHCILSILTLIMKYSNLWNILIRTSDFVVFLSCSVFFLFTARLQPLSTLVKPWSSFSFNSMFWLGIISTCLYMWLHNKIECPSCFSWPKVLFFSQMLNRLQISTYHLNQLSFMKH